MSDLPRIEKCVSPAITPAKIHRQQLTPLEPRRLLCFSFRKEGARI